MSANEKINTEVYLKNSMEILIICSIFAYTVVALPAGNYTASPTRINLGFAGTLNKDLNLVLPNQNTDVAQRKVASFSFLVPERPKGREEAFFDIPTVVQQKDSVYDNAQRFVANILHPKPIVDSITEDEKYGNTGDQFRAIGNAVVGGYEGFSNFLNTVLEFPYEKMKEATRQANAYFSGIGAKLVGL